MELDYILLIKAILIFIPKKNGHNENKLFSGDGLTYIPYVVNLTYFILHI